jgi:hypothetical protein
MLLPSILKQTVPRMKVSGGMGRHWTSLDHPVLYHTRSNGTESYCTPLYDWNSNMWSRMGWLYCTSCDHVHSIVCVAHKCVLVPDQLWVLCPCKPFLEAVMSVLACVAMSAQPSLLKVIICVATACVHASRAPCQPGTLHATNCVQVGWFLHTPFPSSEIYRTLPVREEVLRATLKVMGGGMLFWVACIA